jgi:acyl carrier protein
MIFEKVKTLIAEQLNLDPAGITEKSDLLNELGADSLDVVQMLITLETEFGIEFGDDEIKSIKTAGDVASFIEKHKQE